MTDCRQDIQTTSSQLRENDPDQLGGHDEPPEVNRRLLYHAQSASCPGKGEGSRQSRFFDDAKESILQCSLCQKDFVLCQILLILLDMTQHGLVGWRAHGREREISLSSVTSRDEQWLALKVQWGAQRISQGLFAYLPGLTQGRSDLQRWARSSLDKTRCALPPHGWICSR